VTKQQYIEYLIATCKNYTCTNLSDHLDGAPGTSHDSISDYLRRDKLTARGLWELVAPLIDDGPDSYLILDDSVQNKQYSKHIELVKLQYSGAEHGLVRGIDIVNLIHTNGKDGGYFPVDYRIYDNDSDGKTKHDHFREMLIAAVAENGDIEWMITNKESNLKSNGDPPSSISAQDVQYESAVRWQIEQMHRELKQLVGTQKCQSRKARAQRNHIACCYRAWLSIKIAALKMNKTLYQAQADLFRDYLRAQLKAPAISAYGS
jgi:hypothetical protein